MKFIFLSLIILTVQLLSSVNWPAYGDDRLEHRSQKCWYEKKLREGQSKTQCLRHCPCPKDPESDESYMRVIPYVVNPSHCRDGGYGFIADCTWEGVVLPITWTCVDPVTGEKFYYSDGPHC